MHKYFSAPFPFHELMNGNKKLCNLSVEESIRNNIRLLVLSRMGEFAFDPSMGFEVWEYDRRVFYQEKEPYYDHRKGSLSQNKGLLENASADKYFTDDLKRLVVENELRLEQLKVDFAFKNIDGNRSVYQRHIEVKIDGRIKNTGKQLQPPFSLEILYCPFRVEQK